MKASTRGPAAVEPHSTVSWRTPVLDGLLVSLNEETLWAEGYPPSAQRLLQSALALFAAHGFDATTTRAIAHDAGMSPAALYTHFPTKATALGILIERTHILVRDAMRAARDLSADPVFQVANMAYVHALFHVRMRTPARVANYELGSLDKADFDRVRALRHEMEDYVRAAIADGVAAQCFEVPDLQQATTAVLSLGIDIARWVRPGRRLEPVALAETHCQLVLQMLGSRRRLDGCPPPPSGPASSPVTQNPAPAVTAASGSSAGAGRPGQQRARRSSTLAAALVDGVNSRDRR